MLQWSTECLAYEISLCCVYPFEYAEYHESVHAPHNPAGGRSASLCAPAVAATKGQPRPGRALSLALWTGLQCDAAARSGREELLRVPLVSLGI